jgi:hypothetical protein
MTFLTPALKWTAQADRTRPTAPYTINFTTDTEWLFNLIGDFADVTIYPAGVTIDNRGNQTPITVTIGSQQYTVNPFLRTSFDISDQTNQCKFDGQSGTSVNIFYWRDRRDAGADSINFFGVQTAIAQLAATLNAATLSAIINPDMGEWPEGTPVTNTDNNVQLYGPEGWLFSFNAGSATQGCNVSQQGGSGSRWALRAQRQNAVTDNGTLDVRTQLTTQDSIAFVGQTITISFDLSAGANFSPASGLVTCTVYSGAGVDQNAYNFTTLTAVASKGFNLTPGAVAQRLSISVNFPVGVTQLGFGFSCITTGVAGANDWFQIGRPQIDLGSTGQTYRPVPQQLEHLRCLTFFEIKNPSGDTLGSGLAANTTTIEVSIDYVPKFKPPSSVVVGPTLFTITGFPFAQIAATAVNPQNNGFNTSRVQASCVGGLTAGQASELRGSPNAYIKYNARM